MEVKWVINQGWVVLSDNGEILFKGSREQCMTYLKQQGIICSDRCKKCKYHSKIGGGVMCDYMGVTNHRRPCMAGDKCTVFKKGVPRVKEEA